MAGKISVLGLILSSSLYLRSVKAQFPLVDSWSNTISSQIVKSIFVSPIVESNSWMGNISRPIN